MGNSLRKGIEALKWVEIILFITLDTSRLKGNVNFLNENMENYFFSKKGLEKKFRNGDTIKNEIFIGVKIWYQKILRTLESP